MIPREIKGVVDANIPVGASRRVVHEDCSEGKNAALSVTRRPEGYIFNCFRCGYKGFVGSRQLPSEVVVRMIKRFGEPAHMELETLEIPKDCERIHPALLDELPIQACQFLWDAGIGPLLLDIYPMYWSDAYQRVIFPITNKKGDVVAFLGRDPFFNERNKYESNKYILRKQEGLDRRVYFTCPREPDAEKKVVFVEDVLSAIRVHQATGYETVALLNTHISSDLLVKYKSWYCVAWLDPGKLADMVAVTARCQSYGISMKFISTAKDPKKYNDIGIVEQFSTGGDEYYEA
jgi:hypothetical protein